MASARTTRVFFMCSCFMYLASPVSPLCNTSNIKVPVPELKYVVTSSKNIVVTWTATVELRNISAIYCCHREQKDLVGKCHHVCPSVKKIEDCSVKRNALQLKYSCTFQPTEYVNYVVFLTAAFNDCIVNSVKKTIFPNLRNGYPQEVKNVRLYSNKYALVVQWQKPDQSESIYYTTSYNLSWFEIGPDHRNKTLTQWLNKTKDVVVSIPFTSDILPFTWYKCCVSACLLVYDVCKNYTPHVCDTTLSPEAAPSKPPEFVCVDKKCPQVLKKDVTLVWKLPSQSDRNGISKKIVVEVYATGGAQNRSTTHTLNGTATQYTLTDLRTDLTYKIYVKMCTSGGCSTVSTPVVLSPVKAQEQNVDTRPFSPRVMAIFVTVIVVMIFLTLIVCFVWDSRRNTERSHVENLPRLQEPVVRDQVWTGDSVATSIFVNASDYDFLCAGQRHKEGPCHRAPLSHHAAHVRDYDTSSLESFGADCSSPLLRQSSATSLERRVMVTYLPHTADTVSYLSPVTSDDDSQKLV